MARHVAWATDKPGEGVLLYFQAETAAFSGRWQKASKLLRAAVNVEKRHKFEGRAANWQAITALTEAEFGNSSPARMDATAVLAAARSSDARIVVLLALAQARDEKHAETLADELGKQFSANTLINNVWLSSARAQIEINRGNPGRAIEILQAAAPYELGLYIPPVPHLYAIYLRGQAYLAVRQGCEAATEFEKILDHRGIAGDSPLYSLAHLGLARAYSIAGEREKSRKAYKDFFTLWKDADPDIPILKEAKAEYAKLQ